MCSTNAAMSGRRANAHKVKVRGKIASSSERLAVLVMGTNDLAKELYAEHVPGRAVMEDDVP